MIRFPTYTYHCIHIFHVCTLPLYSGRRKFEYNKLPYERPLTQGSAGEESGETGGESPPTEVRDDERKNIFLQCQKLGECHHVCSPFRVIISITRSRSLEA